MATNDAATEDSGLKRVTIGALRKTDQVMLISAEVLGHLAHRVHSYSIDYEVFLANHITRLFEMDTDFGEKMKCDPTRDFELCDKVVAGKEKTSQLKAAFGAFMGSNAVFVDYIVATVQEVVAKSVNGTEDKRPTSSGEFKTILSEFSKLYIDNHANIESHTMIVLGWWFPQLLEIVTMINLKNGTSGADARKTAIDCIEACVNSFQHLSAVAVYLLCGVYAMAPQWVQLAKDKKTPHYDQVRIKSIEHSQNVRKALSNAYQAPSTTARQLGFGTTSRSSSDLFLTNEERALDDLLTESGFGLAMSIARIILVKEDSDDSGRMLMRYMGFRERLVPLIRVAITREVERTEIYTSLFRGESVATKLLSLFLYSPWGGLRYLKRVITPLVTAIQASDSDFEIDPSKVEKTADLTANVEKLYSAIQNFLRSIFKSVPLFPKVFRLLFHHTKMEVGKKFPSMRSRSVGGFFFLRFLCPAIVTPGRYGLIKDNPSRNVRRGLILVSKSLQNIANGQLFEIATQPHMAKINNVIQDNLDPVLEMFDELANIDDVEESDAYHLFDQMPSDLLRKDFEYVQHLTSNLHNEIGELMAAQHPHSYHAYRKYLNLLEPSVFKSAATKGSVYGSILSSAAEILPSQVWEDLLGIAKCAEVKEVFTLMDHVAHYRPAAQHLLERLFRLHDLTEDLFARWPENGDPFNKEALMRHTLLCCHFLDVLECAPLPWALPVSYEAWMSFLVILQDGFTAIIYDIQWGLKERGRDKETLSLLVTHTRWTVARLLELQNQSRMVEL